jgi:DUF1365 family protein
VASAVVQQTCRKEFYVSPFAPMNSTYQSGWWPPGRVSVVIGELDAEGPLLAAAFSGFALDIVDSVATAATVARIRDAIGPLDLAVLNAGTLPGHRLPA